jgi:hypothetical protein
MPLICADRRAPDTADDLGDFLDLSGQSSKVVGYPLVCHSENRCAVHTVSARNIKANGRRGATNLEPQL